MKSLVKIVDKITGEVISQRNINDLEAVYREACQLEKFGLNIKIVIPTIIENLDHYFGDKIDGDDLFLKSVEEELKNH